MNTEQLRAEFETWAASIGFCVTGKYAETIDVMCAESAFIAGYKAAIQSQDREDAERYRWLRDEEGLVVLPYDDHGLGPEFPYGSDLDKAIDHARRVEGEQI